MATSKGALDGIYPALLAILNNIGPYVEGLSPATVSRILQLYSSMSSPSFLLANETNHTLLASYLDFINAILERQFSSKLPVAIAGMSLTTVQRIPTWYTASSRPADGSKSCGNSRWKVARRKWNAKHSKEKRVHPKICRSRSMISDESRDHR